MKRLLATAAGLVVLAVAAPASAHVEVTSADAARGGEAVLTIRVPTESDTASTTALKFQLPTDTPIASVTVRPHAGWSFTTKTAKLAKPVTTDDGTVTEAVREIDWTADSAASAIRPGEFDEFEILAGPLPDTASVTFKAIQTYSDGTIVSWIETPAPGSTTEPDHPAPVLSLSAAHATAATPAVVNKSSTAAPTALSIVALALAAAALGMVVVQRAKGRAAP